MKEAEIDLFSTPCDALVITTNGTVKKDLSAVMGAGCALEAAIRYPMLPTILGLRLKSDGNHVHILLRTADSPAIVSFPVKERWQEPAKLMLIERSAIELMNKVAIAGWQHVLVPRPGCGNGGLHWDVVKPVVARVFDDRITVVHQP